MVRAVDAAERESVGDGDAGAAEHRERRRAFERAVATEAVVQESLDQVVGVARRDPWLGRRGQRAWARLDTVCASQLRGSSCVAWQATAPCAAIGIGARAIAGAEPVPGWLVLALVRTTGSSE